MSNDAAAADTTDEIKISRLELLFAGAKPGIVAAVKSGAGVPGGRRWPLSVVVGAKVCGNAAATAAVLASSGWSDGKSKLMVAAGRAYTASASASSELAGGGTAWRGDDGNGLDGRDF